MQRGGFTANYQAAYRLRERLKAYAAPARADPFTDDDWRRSMLEREALDAIATIHRWRVTVIPADHEPRTFYLLGRLEQVERRAELIFGPSTKILAVEPAGTGGPESYDRRLNLSGESL